MTDAPKRTSSGYAKQILTEAFSQISARIGLFWIGVIAFFAVFAPFIANSHPYLLKTSDGLSSPLLQHLEPVDVVLLVMLICVFVLFYLKKHLEFNALVLLVVLSISLILSFSLVEPPQLVVYEKYREMDKAGKLIQVI